jgi:hypothetical protein
MALRIKRGTDADRTGYTPESGEPIWTIDTNKLYVGDGATAGGVLVTGLGGEGSTPGIDDTATGVVLTITDAASTFANDVELDGVDLVLGGGEINGTGDINILGSITASGTITGNIANIGSVNVTAGLSAGGTVSAPYIVGDHLGSMFADDSTLLVDGIAGVISGPIDTDYIANFRQPQTTTIESLTSGSTVINLHGFGNTYDAPTVPDDLAKLGIKFAWWDGSAYTDSSLITGFHRTDGTGYLGITVKDGTDSYYNNAIELNGAAGTMSIVANNSVDVQGISFAGGSNITTTDSSSIIITPTVAFNSDVIVENDLVVNNKLVVDTLEVTNFQTVGAGTPELESDTDILLTAGTRVEITSSPLKMASFTTTERNGLSAENGDIIYNTTDNKFQGYENGAWVNLV